MMVLILHSREINFDGEPWCATTVNSKEQV